MRRRWPRPVHRCGLGDSYRDFDGSAEYAECNQPATHRARVLVDPRAYGMTGGPRRERVLMCAWHAKSWDSTTVERIAGELAVTPAYRYRRVTR